MAILLIDILMLALQAYFWLIILTVMVSWLVTFDVLNINNQNVKKFCMLLNRLTNPLVMRLRKIIPPLGGIDLTPMIIIFGIYFLMDLLGKLKYGMMTG